MNSFNQANNLIHDILVHESCVFDIDLDDVKMEGWLYQSNYPLYIPKQDGLGTYYFRIRLWQYDGLSQSLKLINLQYESAPITQIVYVPNSELADSINQLGKKFIENEKFISDVKPLIQKGFREYTIKFLLDSK